MKHRGLRFRVIGQEAIDWYGNHGQKDLRSFKIRMSIILKDFGVRIADEMKPSEIDTWLGAHDWAPAAKNRYKSAFSKAFKIALADGKVSSNPARLVQQRTENNSRIRFLSEEEEKIVRSSIAKRCPLHEEEFDIALNTGMRKGEQYILEWPEVHMKRKRIKLNETKNGSSREIPMNKTCLQAFEALHARRLHDGRVCQSKFGKDLNDSRNWFELVIQEAAEKMPSLKGFIWHCLRHTFISRLVMKGVDLRTVQELAGHKTIAMTARYAHLSSGFRRGVRSRLVQADPSRSGSALALSGAGSAEGRVDLAGPGARRQSSVDRRRRHICTPGEIVGLRSDRV